MFRVKICGITTPDDARAAIDAGADAIGLNFYDRSPRCVTIAEARAVSEAIDGRVLLVGVFVNSSAEEIKHIAAEARLDVVQLHGDESADDLSKLGGERQILRVRRMDEAGLEPVVRDVALCRAAGRVPDAVLIDAAVPGEFGGTGTRADWSRLVGWRSELGEMRLILAGGLTPENVGDAIRMVSPSGVDVASGVEFTTRAKDIAKMRSFVETALRAYNDAES